MARLTKWETYVIEPQFNFAREFSEALAGVTIGHKFVCGDKTGKNVWNPTD